MKQLNGIQVSQQKLVQGQFDRRLLKLFDELQVQTDESGFFSPNLQRRGIHFSIPSVSSELRLLTCLSKLVNFYRGANLHRRVLVGVKIQRHKGQIPSMCWLIHSLCMNVDMAETMGQHANSIWWAHSLKHINAAFAAIKSCQHSDWYHLPSNLSQAK